MKIELRAGDDRATVLSHGAQVMSWTAGGGERLYVSPMADFRAGQAIRGGIPVCFPQFDQRGSLPKHGFARNREWWVVSQSGDAVTLELTDDDDGGGEGGGSGGGGGGGGGGSSDIKRIWPHRFRARVIVTLSRDAIDVELAVENRGQAMLEFTGALHTYLRVGDPAAARLDGLAGIEYVDHRSGASSIDPQRSLPIDAIGRTYRTPGHSLELVEGQRRVEIASRGFENVVVWNPGAATVFTDLPGDGWREFLCVEAAQVTRPIVVEAGQQWIGGQRLRVSMTTNT